MKIEDNIPLPKPRAHVYDSPVIQLASEIQPGQSVLCETKPDAYALQAAIKRAGKHSTQRSVEGGYRVYCIEKGVSHEQDAVQSTP